MSLLKFRCLVFAVCRAEEARTGRISLEEISVLAGLDR